LIFIIDLQREPRDLLPFRFQANQEVEEFAEIVRFLRPESFFKQRPVAAQEFWIPLATHLVMSVGIVRSSSSKAVRMPQLLPCDPRAISSN
jgi:hypothetical protein